MKPDGAITNRHLSAAKRLHQHIMKSFWTGRGVEGSDPGVRLNARFYRFFKSYLRFIPWSDRYYYLQAQGYWIHANWMLFDLLGDEQYRNVATVGSEQVLERQKAEGYWQYPFPEWSDRIATVEGCYGALGMLHTFRRTRDERLAGGVLRWFDFLKREIGFREEGDTLAVQYFARAEELARKPLANIQLGRCPNNSTLLLMLLGEAYDATKDPVYLDYREGMINFLKFAQMPNGKFPYIVPYKEYPGKENYLCYQYNAFQFLDLARYYDLTGDERIRTILSGIGGFLGDGVTENGSARFDLFHEKPFIPYYTAVLGAALTRATELGLRDYSGLSEKVYDRLLSVQKPGGGFTFSHGDYRILSDRRSYPRNESMILKHLLMRASYEMRKGRGNGSAPGMGHRKSGIQKN